MAAERCCISLRSDRAMVETLRAHRGNVPSVPVIFVRLKLRGWPRPPAAGLALADAGVTAARREGTNAVRARHLFGLLRRKFPGALASEHSVVLIQLLVSFPWLTTGTSNLVRAIYSGTVPVWEARTRGTAEGAGLESPVHVPSFVDCQLTRVFAAQYSAVLLHGCFPFCCSICTSVLHPIRGRPDICLHRRPACRHRRQWVLLRMAYLAVPIGAVPAAIAVASRAVHTFVLTRPGGDPEIW
jgi:hypothetical protein